MFMQKTGHIRINMQRQLRESGSETKKTTASAKNRNPGTTRATRCQQVSWTHPSAENPRPAPVKSPHTTPERASPGLKTSLPALPQRLFGSAGRAFLKHRKTRHAPAAELSGPNGAVPRHAHIVSTRAGFLFRDFLLSIFFTAATLHTHASRDSQRSARGA